VAHALHNARAAWRRAARALVMLPSLTRAGQARRG